MKIDRVSPTNICKRFQCQQNEVVPGGAICTEHFFDVPVDHGGGPLGQTIRIFVREMVLAKHAAKVKELPVLIFLQGGPGFPAPRPSDAQIVS